MVYAATLATWCWACPVAAPDTGAQVASGAQPGDARLDRRAVRFGVARHRAFPRSDQLVYRGHGRDVQGVAAARGRSELRRVEPLPAGPRWPTGRSAEWTPPPLAGHAGAHRDEAVPSWPPLVRSPGRGAASPLLAPRPGPVRAGPDRAGTEGRPRCPGRLPRRWHRAPGGGIRLSRPDRPQRPGTPVVAGQSKNWCLRECGATATPPGCRRAGRSPPGRESG